MALAREVCECSSSKCTHRWRQRPMGCSTSCEVNGCFSGESDCGEDVRRQFFNGLIFDIKFLRDGSKVKSGQGSKAKLKTAFSTSKVDFTLGMNL